MSNSELNKFLSNRGIHSDNESIGIVGIGILGAAIAEQFVKGGLVVLGFDLNSPRTDQVNLCKNAQEVFRECDTVVLCLPTSKQVGEVIEEVRDCLVPGRHLIMDSTTGTPGKAIENQRKLAELGVTYVEATIAGSSKNLEFGEATILLGCDEMAVARSRRFVSLLSNRIFYVGDAGSASRFKLVHNLILGLSRAGLAEGLAFAESLGFDAENALEILIQSPAYSATMDLKGMRMASGDFLNPQARLSQHLKDVGLILEQGKQSNAKLPMSELHHQLLLEAESMGMGELDNCSIIEVFRNGNSIGVSG